MDINNYSYSKNFLENDSQTLAHFENENGYKQITLEQWGSLRNFKTMVVTVCSYNGDIDICEIFKTDISSGWETIKETYKKAVEIYNKYFPEEVTPLF